MKSEDQHKSKYPSDSLIREYEGWSCIKQQQEVQRLILRSSDFVSIILVESVSYLLSHAYHWRNRLNGNP